MLRAEHGATVAIGFKLRGTICGVGRPTAP